VVAEVHGEVVGFWFGDGMALMHGLVFRESLDPFALEPGVSISLGRSIGLVVLMVGDLVEVAHVLD
jgi:hypothetical protein